MSEETERSTLQLVNTRVGKHDVRGGADKSLDRPGRKEATTRKLGFIQYTLHEAP